MAAPTILTGDCLAVLATLPADSFQACVTSPPYYGLRDYGVDGQIGLEESPEAYVAKMVEVFRAVRRVLRPDGTVFLNLGDSYYQNGISGPQVKTGARASRIFTAAGTGARARRADACDRLGTEPEGSPARGCLCGSLCGACRAKPKDLLGIPWMVAFALRADGWFLRSAIVWAKPNPMPESVRDRPTSSYEMVFLLSKAARYFYDADSIREPLAESSVTRLAQDVDGQAGSLRANGGAKTNGPMKTVGGDKQRGHGRRHAGFNDRWDAMSRDEQMAGGANARNVWTIATQPYSGAHFATMPPDLAERCIKAGSKPGDHVLDPFGGAGTTGLVASRLQRRATLIELNPAYADMARERCRADAPLLMAEVP